MWFELKPDALALAEYMSSLSEEAWCAGWLSGLELRLWRLVLDGQLDYGWGRSFSAEHAQRLKDLSERCGGWIIFDDDAEESWIPIEEWRGMFSRVETRRSSRESMTIGFDRYDWITAEASRSVASLQRSMKRLIDAGSAVRPHSDWAELRSPDYEGEVAPLLDWLTGAFVDRQPFGDGKSRGLHFVIFDSLDPQRVRVVPGLRVEHTHSFQASGRGEWATSRLGRRSSTPCIPRCWGG